jgi:hypothetical protein
MIVQAQGGLGLFLLGRIIQTGVLVACAWRILNHKPFCCVDNL